MNFAWWSDERIWNFITVFILNFCFLLTVGTMISKCRAFFYDFWGFNEIESKFPVIEKEIEWISEDEVSEKLKQWNFDIAYSKIAEDPASVEIF